MRPRTELHQILVSLGIGNVYFQPPESTSMSYPCIRYERSDILARNADNFPYGTNVKYTLILIGKDPDNDWLETILNLPHCSYDRHYVASNLHHDVFTIFF